MILEHDFDDFCFGDWDLSPPTGILGPNLRFALNFEVLELFSEEKSRKNKHWSSRYIAEVQLPGQKTVLALHTAKAPGVEEKCSTDLYYKARKG